MAGRPQAWWLAWFLTRFKVSLPTGTWVVDPTQAEKTCSDSLFLTLKPSASHIQAAQFLTQISICPDHKPLGEIFRSAEDGMHREGQTIARTPA